jgi:hypothetical protein
MYDTLTHKTGLRQSIEVDLKPPSVSHGCLIAGHVDLQHVLIFPGAYVTTVGSVCIQRTILTPTARSYRPCTMRDRLSTTAQYRFLYGLEPAHKRWPARSKILHASYMRWHFLDINCRDRATCLTATFLYSHRRTQGIYPMHNTLSTNAMWPCGSPPRDQIDRCNRRAEAVTCNPSRILCK